MYAFFNDEYIYITFFQCGVYLHLQSYPTYNPTYDLKAEHDFVILFHIYFAILHIIIIFSKATKLGHIYNISITL